MLFSVLSSWRQENQKKFKVTLMFSRLEYPGIMRLSKDWGGTRVSKVMQA